MLILVVGLCLCSHDWKFIVALRERFEFAITIIVNWWLHVDKSRHGITQISGKFPLFYVTYTYCNTMCCIVCKRGASMILKLLPVVAQE